jgi:hypothetical protein
VKQLATLHEQIRNIKTVLQQMCNRSPTIGSHSCETLRFTRQGYYKKMGVRETTLMMTMVVGTNSAEATNFYVHEQPTQIKNN